jgi:hypothetical protein
MDPTMPFQLDLRPDERLLWCGHPDPGVWFTPADAFMIPFSLLWTGFAIFWEAGVVTEGGPGFSAVWGVPFVALGIYLVFGRFIYKHYRKKRTSYWITTERAAVIVGPGLLADSPVLHQPVTIKRSRDARHASVAIGNATEPGRAFGFRRTPSWSYANTGLEALTRSASLPVAFYDVADPDAMLIALEQARGFQSATPT